MTTHDRINRLRIDAINSLRIEVIEDIEEERLYRARDKLTIAIELYEQRIRFEKGE